jgi:hypothetical protein
MGVKQGVKHQRRVEGLCLRCDVPALDDSDWCEEHRDEARTYARDSMRRIRRVRRSRGLCGGCGRPSEKFRCAACAIASGRLPKGVAKGVKSRAVDVRITVERDGYARTRNHGRGIKGPPTKAASDATDLAMATASLHRGREGLAAAAELGEEFSREVKRAAKQAALGHIHHMVRVGIEVLDRHKYPWRGDDE